jgi:DNA-binding SARP family transcriptional activator/tetratricopeptide (TPR) repeat protein
MEMRVCLSGSLRITVDGARCDDRLERRQARALAAFLVLHRGRPMSREEVIAALWPEGGEHRHDASLRVLLSAVRRAFGSDSLPGRNKLQLVLPPNVWVDVERAASALDDAEAALREGRWTDAAHDSSEAAALLADPLLAGESAHWLDDARREAADLATRALEVCARAELELGNPRVAERAARDLIARSAFREQGHALLMQALADQGNTAEALIAYERLRELLRDELGTTPSRAVSELHARILAEDDDDRRPGGAGPAAASPPPPLPVALAPLDGVHFVGRQLELQALSAAWERARAGSRRTVLIAGEPGIGKTSLVGELAKQAAKEGAFVIYGRCDEDVGFAFQPFVEALRTYVSSRSPELIREQVGKRGAELARVLPELAELLPDTSAPARADAALDQYLMFEAVVGFLSGISRERPLLLVLDDLHWAARPTLLLLRHLVRSPPDMALCVVGTFRDTELPRAHPLTEMLADLRREPGIERHALAGLSEQQVEDLLALERGRELDERSRSLAHAVHEETRGNPFFVGEVLRHVAEAPPGPVDGGEFDLEQLGIPEGVREVVSRRLMRLSDDAIQVLTVAAVAGPLVTLPLLERIPDAGRSPDRLLDALDEAVRARVLMESQRLPGRYTFAHALVRQAVYVDLTAARRGRLHRQVADALEQLCTGELDEHLHELAHHFAQAAPGEEDKAIDYLVRAGDQAQSKLAYDQALTHYRQALELVEPFHDPAHNRRRCEVTISLGEAQRRAGYRVFRETLLDGARGARELGDPALMARAALANNRGFFSSVGQIDDERVESLADALAAYDPAPSATRARLLSQLGEELIFGGDFELRCQVSDEAVGMAREIDDPGTLAMVLVQRIPTIWFPDNIDDRAASAAEAARIADALDDPLLSYFAAAYGVNSALEQGDLHRADVQMARLQRLTTGLRQPILSWYDLVIAAKREQVAGTMDDAERLALKGFEAGQEAGQPDAFQLFAAQLFVIRFHQRRLGELADAMVGAPRPSGRSRTVPMLVGAFMATIHCELGRLDDARAPYERLLADGLEQVPRDFSWLTVVSLAAEACARFGDRERAPMFMEALAPHRGRYIDVGSAWLGSVERSIGLLHGSVGEYDEAERALDAAATAHQAAGATAWLARTRSDHARLLRERGHEGDLERAAVLARQAADGARSVGAEPDSEVSVELH